MPDWKSKESSDHLLAAIIASLPDNVKLNYNRIASLYGQNATYDSIEGRCRTLKKEAQKMKDDLASGVLQPAPGRANGSNNSTPRKPKSAKKTTEGGSFQNGVQSGRVSKSASSSPTKKRSAGQLKRELLEASASSSAMSSTDYLSSAEHSTTGVMDDSFVFECDPVVQASFHNPNDYSFDDLDAHVLTNDHGPMIGGPFWDPDHDQAV